MDTKERILDSALTLFSERGYGSVSVADIAGAVGIKAPSLYKHFASKQAIFDAILDRMQSDYQRKASEFNLDGTDPGSDAGVFSGVSADSLVDMVSGMFGYFLHDPYASRFRRMLTLEQFSDPRSAEALSSQYFDGPMGYESVLFGRMLSAGILKGDGPDLMALEFYSPVFLLLTVCDRQPGREGECRAMLERHVRDFAAIHGVVR